MATKTIYLVRHGESVANTQPIFQGLDTPLTEKGREQAVFMAHRAERLELEEILSSPLERAKETAEIIAEKVGLPIEFSSLLEERRKPGALNGKPHTDQEAVDLFKQWEESLFEGGPRIQDGENFDDIRIRANQVLQYLASRKGKTILVVTHGMFLRAITATVLFDDLFSVGLFGKMKRSMKTENTGLTVLQYDSEISDPTWGTSWRLLTWNDHAHLG
jgi:probable phosphoglycerate mutase